MGNSKCKEMKLMYALTDENLARTERDVLKYSGLPDEQIVQRNVKVGEYKGEDVTLRTVLIGTSDKPVLVLIHGYGGSGALFFKVMKQLAQHFYLILVDLIGMGGSSRPKNFDQDKFTPQQAVDYFVDYIESWR